MCNAHLFTSRKQSTCALLRTGDNMNNNYNNSNNIKDPSDEKNAVERQPCGYSSQLHIKH